MHQALQLLMPAFMQVKPTHVLNAAGLTGRPNVDWCETHKVSQSTISDAILGWCLGTKEHVGLAIVCMDLCERNGRMMQVCTAHCLLVTAMQADTTYTFI